MPKLKKKTRQMQPSRMLVLGFSIIILAGATLLFLPISEWNDASHLYRIRQSAATASCFAGNTGLDS